jgi:hypothetical protein
MATTVKPKATHKRIKGVDYITNEEGRRILDRQARESFGMSGEEFVRRYRSGETKGLDHSEVTRLSMLIPYYEH